MNYSESVRPWLWVRSCLIVRWKCCVRAVKETEVAAEMEFAARRGGAEEMSFSTIIASGARSALPHGRASDQPIAAGGFVVCDFGVILSGYCSDQTRTVWVGPVPREPAAPMRRCSTPSRRRLMRSDRVVRSERSMPRPVRSAKGRVRTIFHALDGARSRAGDS